MNTWHGARLKLRLLGASHAPSVGMELHRFPGGFLPDLSALQLFLNRRSPGRGEHMSARREADLVVFTEGLTDGRTNGGTLCAQIKNTDARKQDYVNQGLRPSHADYPAWVKYGTLESGGGVFSGRMTAPLCIAGGLCLQWLQARGIFVGAHILQIGSACDSAFDPLAPQLPVREGAFSVLRRKAEEEMREQIMAAKSEGDSIGGVIECAVTGLPVGVGEPLFGGLEGRISALLFAIPAVKGLRFGSPCIVRGSEYNDPMFRDADGSIRMRTNHAGGILGGLSDGMPLLFSVEIKPTPSIAREQESISAETGENIMLTIKGRHDPCIVPRAVACVEAAAAIAVMDAVMESEPWS